MVSNEVETRWAAKTPSWSFCTEKLCKAIVFSFYHIDENGQFCNIIKLAERNQILHFTKDTEVSHELSWSQTYLPWPNDKTPFAVWNLSRLMKTKVTLQVKNRLK